jgi:hypothetical protein
MCGVKVQAGALLLVVRAHEEVDSSSHKFLDLHGCV